ALPEALFRRQSRGRLSLGGGGGGLVGHGVLPLRGEGGDAREQTSPLHHIPPAPYRARRFARGFRNLAGHVTGPPAVRRRLTTPRQRRSLRRMMTSARAEACCHERGTGPRDRGRPSAVASFPSEAGAELLRRRLAVHDLRTCGI